MLQRDANRDKRIRAEQPPDAYLEGSLRMGDELRELSRTLAPLPDKLTQLEQRDPNNFSFSRAAKLVGMGASVDDLTQSVVCRNRSGADEQTASGCKKP